MNCQIQRQKIVAFEMVGRNPRYDVKNIIVATLEEKYPESTRYTELVKQVNRRFQEKKTVHFNCWASCTYWI
jgi:hypothetical protein